MTGTWRKIKNIFREETGEKPSTYLLELDKYCAKFVFVLSLLSLVIWIRYIEIDKSLYPNFPWMIYLRYGLMGVGALCLISLLSFRFLYQGIILMTILALYYIVAAAVLAGVTTGRSIYFAGYIVSILVVLFTPLPRRISYIVIYLSVFCFGFFAFINHINLKDKETAFMVSLCLNVIFLSSVFIYILDRTRRRSYFKSKEIENRIKEIEYQKKEIQSLNEFAKVLNEEQDIDRVLDQVFNFIQKTYGIDYIWLTTISEDKKQFENYKFVTSVELPMESINFMNSFKAPMVEETGTFYLTYLRRKSFYLNRNIDAFLTSEIDKRISEALNLQGFLIIPLLIKNEVIALISFTKFRSNIHLNSNKRREIERFCEQIAGALNTAKILKDLNRSIQDLKDSQAHLIQSEKMAGLGQIVASVAHEINTPLGAIKASSTNLLHSWNKLMLGVKKQYSRIPELDSGLLQSLDYFLKDTIRPVLTTKEARIQKKELKTELMSKGFTQELADEIGDILSEVSIFKISKDLMFILNHPDWRDYLDFITLSRGIAHNNDNILIATDKTARIVSALKTFSQKDNHGRKTLYNFKNGIHTILTIYGSLLKQGVEIEEEYESIPDFLAFGEELNQVWTNLIHNSIQAMNSSGKIWIIAKKISANNNQYVQVTIKDNGPGIPLENFEKIFNPFFTTKGSGEGSGLGLHITRQIVDKHNGSIDLKSIPGDTQFTVTIPLEATNVLELQS
jgi:two-component system NtrC family sensor kinase